MIEAYSRAHHTADRQMSSCFMMCSLTQCKEGRLQSCFAQSKATFTSSITATQNMLTFLAYHDHTAPARQPQNVQMRASHRKQVSSKVLSLLQGNGSIDKTRRVVLASLAVSASEPSSGPDRYTGRRSFFFAKTTAACSHDGRCQRVKRLRRIAREVGVECCVAQSLDAAPTLHQAWTGRQYASCAGES